jgi:hypothetical protein
MKKIVSRRTRTTLFMIGLLLVLCGLSALFYAFWPLADTSLRDILSATIFAPP